MLNARVDATEISVGSQLPYSQQISPSLVVTAAGDYISTIRVHGIAFDTMTSDEVDGLNRTWLSAINTALSSPNHGMWTHIVRSRRDHVVPDADYDNHFSEVFMKEYNGNLANNNFFTNRLYLSPVYRLAGTKADRVGLRLTRKNGTDYMALHEQAKEYAERFNSTLMTGLKRYHPQQLGIYEGGAGDINTEIGEFYAQLLNHAREPANVRLQPANLSHTLQMATLDFGEETIRIVNPAHTSYAAVMSLASPYTAESLDAKVHASLLTANFEFVLSQSFTTMPHDSAERALKAQENRIKSTAHNEIMLKDIKDALENLQAGKFKMLEHEWLLVIYGATMKELNASVNEAVALLNHKNLRVVRESGGPLIAAFFSIFPGAFQHGRIRARPISSANMAKFFPMHNFPNGNNKGSQWGKPVMVFTTTSRNPYYVNFHVSRDRMAEQGIDLEIDTDADADDDGKIDRKEVGNYYVIGGTGGGKTTLKCALRAAVKRQATRGNRKVRTITFDRDYGEEIATRAMGGQYFILEPGHPSGINPFQWPNTEETQELIFELAKWAAEHATPYKVTATDLIDLKRAIDSVFDLPLRERRFGSVLSYLPSHQTKESLYQSLNRWRRDEDDPKANPFGWVLDSPHDRLSIGSADTCGFDFTQVVDLAYAKTPLMQLISAKILRELAGAPHIIDIAEAWSLLSDELTANFINQKSRTIRKQNGIIGIDTQNAEDLTNSKLGSQFLNQFPTGFIIPNDKARPEVYIDQLGLTPREFELIRTSSGSGMMLIKKGNESIMAQMDLTQFANSISVLSSSTDNVHICREVIREFGSDPKDWLPRFYERRLR